MRCEVDRNNILFKQAINFLRGASGNYQVRETLGGLALLPTQLVPDQVDDGTVVPAAEVAPTLLLPTSAPQPTPT